jgi:hypothetical protein
MSIPFNTTTVTVSRLVDPVDTDEYDPVQPSPSQIVAGVRAVVSLPGGSVNLTGGDRVDFNTRLTCDLCDLQTEDIVTDDIEGTAWVCLWSRKSIGLGLDHIVAGLRLVTGAS